MKTVKKSENVAYWKKTVNTISQAIGPDYTAAYTYKLSDIYLAENDVAALFHFYKLRSVKLRILFTVNTATGQAPTGGEMGWLYILGNQSITPTPPTANYYLNDSHVKIRRLDKLDGCSKYSTFYYKVKPVTVVFDSAHNAQVQSAIKKNDWISFDQGGIDYIHRGVDIYCHGGAGQTGHLDIWTTYYFTSKGPR